MSDATSSGHGCINHGGHVDEKNHHIHPTDITNDDRQLLAGVRERFKRLTEAPGTKVFTTNADGSELWRVFVSNLPAYLRPVYACNTCRWFVEQYGGLVVIDPDDGLASSLFWGSVTGDSPFALSINSMARLVNRAHVSGVFLSPLMWWGAPVTGPWEHFAVQAPKHMHYTHPLLTADQMMAEKRQDYEMLDRACVDYDTTVVANVVDLLAAGDTLYRSEKVLGVAKWLYELKLALRTSNTKTRANLKWLAVANAPAGYCHVRSSMIGTLLDDVAAGMNVKAVMARFAEKMNPLQYRRTTALPTAQSVKAATEAVDKLRAAGALERRFLRPDEVKPMWRPVVVKDAPANTGVFKNVALADAMERRGHTRVEAPRQNITWVKFRDTVLPNALRIEVHTPYGTLLPFIALTTAVHADAPPVLQWDSEGHRNPASWYVMSGGATPRQFNLTGDGNVWYEVSSVCALPPQWSPNAQPHWGEGAVFVIDGCRHTGSGTGLFTEQMKSEWHPYRRVLEEYLRDAKVAGGDGPCAAGIDVRNGKSGLIYNSGWLVRVTTATATTQYKIDRWD